MKDSILIVEDETNLGETLKEYLEGIGHKCFWASNCHEANHLFSEHNPSIVLMDIGLPDGNGIELAKKFRSESKNFVLLFLSAQNDPETRVQGLEIGAEDYITKPFALKELVIRLERILNSSNQSLDIADELSFGSLKIWFKRYEVQDGNGNIIPLSQKECAILQLLFKNSGMAVNREDIIDEIWGKDQFPSQRTVDNYIVKLRKWCETDKSNIIQIVSIRGIGYKMTIKE